MISTLVVCATLLVLWWRAEPFIRRGFEYLFAKLEKEFPLETLTPVQVVVDDEIPQDLIALSQLESEGWAKEAALRTMRELYDLTHDWGKVRTIMVSAHSQRTE